jgi:hypothetical protein
MSKRQRDARERARRAQEALRRAEARRKRLRLAWLAVGLVVVLFAVLVVVRLASGGKRTPEAAPVPSGSAAEAVTAAVTSVPASVLDQVGAGTVNALPSAVKGQAKLTDGGKPLVVYVGAEYCPFCAAQRWPMVIALSRFGTFDGLRVSASAADDVFPNTATLSFHGSTYRSDYLAFQGVETTTNVRQGQGYAPLQSLTSQQQQVFDTFNAPPYVPKDSAGSIPFVDFANQAVLAGASYSPQLLAGKTAEQIAAAVNDPSSDIARAVNGTANAMTALLCTLTGNQPAQVCSGTAAQAYAGRFNAS